MIFETTYDLLLLAELHYIDMLKNDNYLQQNQTLKFIQKLRDFRNVCLYLPLKS
jgi:hypothetical protein